MLRCLPKLSFRFQGYSRSVFKARFPMASDVLKKKPAVYVVSEIPGIHQYVCDGVPLGVEVKYAQLNQDKEWTPEDTLNFLKQCEVLLCDPGILVEVYDALPNLQWAHCTWAAYALIFWCATPYMGFNYLISSLPHDQLLTVGLKGVENLVATVNEKKVSPRFLVTRHSGEAFALLMAEYILAQILSIEKKLIFCHECQEAKFWPAKVDLKKFKSRSLNELVVCILGVGNMGFGAARLLKTVGCNVIGLSRYQRSFGAKEYAYFDEISTSFSDLLPQCDYLCNTLPSTQRTRGLLDKEVLLMCKKAPIFINVGRGDIINEDTLFEALEKGWISHAVLDVFHTEPLPPTSPLWKSKQITITPHIAALSQASHVVEEFLKNYRNFIEEKELNNSVNWSAGY